MTQPDSHQDPSDQDWADQIGADQVWGDQVGGAAQPLLLTYQTPAPLTAWESHSLPLGNGTLAASIFGGVSDDLITLNEKSLWSGGPDSRDPDSGAFEGNESTYRFGNYPPDQVAQRQRALAEVRRRIDSEGQVPPEEVMAALGQPRVRYGSMQTFGRLAFTHEVAGQGLPAGDYRRTLDLRTGIVQVTGGQGGFVREYLVSHPDRVLAVRLSGSGPVSLGLTWLLAADPHDLLGEAQLSASAHNFGGRIWLRAIGVDNGLRVAGAVELRTHGGEVSCQGDGLRVEGASEVLLVWSGGTDYAAEYPHYRSGVDPWPRIRDDVSSAADRGWTELRSRHVADHDALFSRFELDLGGRPSQTDTDTWLTSHGQHGEADRHLEMLHAQYGRYLLIASSRAGADSLPANLQGGWNQVNDPPWSANYHVNINLQMNYWAAWAAGLAECAEPYLRWQTSLLAPGRESARTLLAAAGWLVMNETNVWGFTGVHDWPTAAWFPEAGAWLAQAQWWNLVYTGDLDQARRQGWPLLAGACELWLSSLQPSSGEGEPSLFANPSYSPEHGWFSAGAAMSQQIVHELFVTTVAAADQLGLSGGDGALADPAAADLVARVSAALPRLADGLDIDPDTGGLREWRIDDPHGAEPHHRHTSQLYALWPGRALLGSQPRSRAEALVAAARATLNDRGDGGTGWSKAWKINLWARLGDGNRAHRLLGELLRESTLPNLWDTHPPFQIDGNFGATSGVLLMLAQSDLGGLGGVNDPVELRLLPALPSAWPQGSVRGLRAWGGIIVDLVWRDAQLVRARLTATRAVQVRVSWPGADPLECELSAAESRQFGNL